MAPWVASFDWGKGRVLATSQYLVAVGPASKWNGSTILRGHVQDMMAAAESAFNAQAREATGVELGFAAADDCLAAKLADPALFQQVLLAQSAEQYHELMRLMSEDGCKWAQVGTCDRGEDSGLVKEVAWGEALLLEYFPVGGVSCRMWWRLRLWMTRRSEGRDLRRSSMGLTVRWLYDRRLKPLGDAGCSRASRGGDKMT